MNPALALYRQLLLHVFLFVAFLPGMLLHLLLLHIQTLILLAGTGEARGASHCLIEAESLSCPGLFSACVVLVVCVLLCSRPGPALPQPSLQTFCFFRSRGNAPEIFITVRASKCCLPDCPPPWLSALCQHGSEDQNPIESWYLEAVNIAKGMAGPSC